MGDNRVHPITTAVQAHGELLKLINGVNNTQDTRRQAGQLFHISSQCNALNKGQCHPSVI